MFIKNCPNCNDEKIEISFNPKLRRHTLTCFNCQKDYKIQAEQVQTEGPECKSNDIR